MIQMRSGLKRLAALGIDGALRLLPRAADIAGRAIGPAPRVLVIRCDHIGDAVMATSVLEPIRRALSPARLDVLAGPWGEAIFRANPAVDDVLVFATPWWLAARGAGPLTRFRAWGRLPAFMRRLRARRYDVAIDLRGDLRQIAFFAAGSGAAERVSSDRTGGRSLLTRCSRYEPGRHEVDQDAAVATLVGAVGPFAPTLALPVTADASSSALGVPEGAPFVVLALAGTEENRSWPASFAAEVADAIWRDHAVRAVIVGTDADRARATEIATLSNSPVIDLCGRTTLPALVATIGRARAAVVVDSGPMHIASALGVPTVALFGPGDPAECAPRGATSVVLSTKAPCGCVHPRCDFGPGPGRCMLQLTPDRVIDALTPLLSSMAPVA